MQLTLYSEPANLSYSSFKLYLILTVWAGICSTWSYGLGFGVHPYTQVLPVVVPCSVQGNPLFYDITNRKSCQKKKRKAQLIPKL